MNTIKTIQELQVEVFNDILHKETILQVHQPQNKITQTFTKAGITTYQELADEVIRIAERDSKLTRSQREFITIGYMMCNHEAKRLYEEQTKPKSVIIDEKGEAI